MEPKNEENENRKIDLIIKLLGLIATQSEFSKMNQQDQIVQMDKMRFRNKEIASLYGIKPQQVNNALLRKKKRKK